MILTVTANPSVDRTASLSGALQRGGVNRLGNIRDVAGGKGINVARVLAAARPDYEPPQVRALFPAPEDDPFVAMVAAAQLPFSCVPVPDPVRVNLTVTEPGGTTTKLNAPGAELSEDAREAFTGRIRAAAAEAGPGSWVALCGSLPAGMPTGFYLDLIAALDDVDVRVAMDTSDAPLEAFARVLRTMPSRAAAVAPDLIKPNGLELGQLLGVDGHDIEQRATAGDVTPAARAAHELSSAGVGAVLVTLGAAGAVLATEGSVWWAPSPEVAVVSTVGAGDSSLAGYLLAAHRGLGPADRLRWAVLHGSVAASLPGTGLPVGLDLSGADSVPVTHIAL